MTAPSPKLSPAEIAKIKAHREAAHLDAAPFWELASEICQQYGVRVNDLSARTRKTPAVCAARDMVCYIAHGRGWTQTKIGKMLRRDSTSVCHAVGKMVDKLGPVPAGEK